MARLEDILEGYPRLKGELESVRAVMDGSLRTGYREMDAPLQRFLENPGKMLRPLMVIISSRFGSVEKPEKVHRLAAAIEILHIASLVHDDIIDEAPKRRGITTLHSSEGIRKAVLMGDYMFTRAVSLVIDAVSEQDAGYLAAAVGRICESEISQHWSPDSGRRDYRRRIAGKTAMLFTLGLSTGARECEADEEVVQNLRRAGYAMGMSFQIVDDILDYTADERLTGKPGGQDLNRGLETLPLLLAAESGDRKIRKLMKKPGRGTGYLRRIRRAVVEAGGVEMAWDWAQYYDGLAALYLGRLPDRPERSALEQIATAVATRNK